jgi:hypothetical protein
VAGTRRSVSWLRLLAVVLSLAPGAYAAAFDFSETSWEGTSGLLELARETLGTERVKVAGVLDYSQLSPNDGLVLLRPLSEPSYEQLSRFMAAGGRVAVLDDFGAGAALLARFQIHRVNAAIDPLETLRGNPNLAIARPALQPGAVPTRHPVVANVDRLVTNHPSVFTHQELTPILLLPSARGAQEALAITGVIGERGRLLAMGDPSSFINLMLRYPGNRAFARGLVKYLVGPDQWGEREGKLWLLTNDFLQSGSYGDAPGLLEQAREVAGGLAESVRLTRERGFSSMLMTLLAALAALGALTWAALRAARPYRPASPKYALPTPLAAQGGTAGFAAVLAAPTTHRALTLVELKAALTEALSAKLGLAQPSRARLVEEAHRQGILGAREQAELASLFRELDSAENGLLSGHPQRIGRSEVDHLRRRALKLFEALQGKP